ncbi:uncharacterized protein N7511_004807 [Penicillium nucicola]|uniref:uncharacterized protein n=1 Tax=Penicillium nucicola TaxID=1850975 RepID=UPI00254510DF|nr:uncharacterized protein N7511_004807 [Penicillium nucicola]KAJ5767191.1 hypothetical protein N7511_004807 [Penicillium nucicola]
MRTTDKQPTLPTPPQLPADHTGLANASTDVISGYGYAFSTQAVQAAHVLSHRTPPSPSASASPSSVGNSIADADSLSHSALNTGSGSRPSPGHVGAVETEPPVVDFLDLGNGIGRKVRVFLIIFLGAVGVVEVLFWGRGVWVWYTGNGKGKGGGSGSWRDSYGAK